MVKLMGTVAEEIFSMKLSRDVSAGEIVLVDIDVTMSHDNTTPLAIKALRNTGKPLYDKNRIVIIFDHVQPPASVESATLQKEVLEFIKKEGIKNFFREGICHQVLVERGFVLPGRVIIGGDSHTCTYGALGAFGTGVGSTDIGVSYATGKNWFRVPETFYFDVNGSFAKGVYPKDLILKIIGKVGARGATYKACEFGGKTIESMAMGDRLTLTNMAIEMGGKTGLIKTDKVTENYLKSRGYPYKEIVPKDPNYEKIFEFDVDDLTPQVAVSPKVDNVYPVEKYAGTDVDEVFIGTCTNGRIEDLEIVARMFKGKKLNPLLKTIIVPASNEIYFEAMNRGYIKIFMDAGAMVCNPGCGPCIGRHQGVLAPGDRALTTMNRNFIGRMGSDKGEIIIASPATAAATALNGKITDPREVM